MLLCRGQISWDGASGLEEWPQIKSKRYVKSRACQVFVKVITRICPEGNRKHLAILSRRIAMIILESHKGLSDDT